MQFSPVFQRRAAWIGAAIAVIAYYPRYRHGIGADIFTAAANCMLHSQTPRHCGDLIYAYPPFFALLWTPFAPLPAWLREAAWYLVITGTLFASLRLCERLARRLFPGDWTEGELAVFRILTFVLGLKFILAVLENQAYDSIAVVFILLGLLALMSDRPLAGAASLATAAALKVTPLIFLPYLIFKRRFAAAGMFVVVLSVLSVLPDILLPPKHSWHVTVWLRDVILAPLNFSTGFDLPFWVTDSPMNQTFRAAVVRLFTGVHEQKPFLTVLAIMKSRAFAVALGSVMAVYIAIVSLVMLKSQRDDRLIGVDGALLVISALLLTPVSSQSHFLALLLPYALIVAAMVKDPPMRPFHGTMLTLSFVLATATSNDVAGRSLTAWALWSSLPVYGTLILVTPLSVLIWRVRGRPAAA